MSFSFACARPLYAKNLHPRLLIGPAELAAIRQRTRRGVGKRLLAAMRQRLDPMVQSVLQAGDDQAAMTVVQGAYFARPIWHCLDEMAALGKIEQRQEPVAAVRRLLLAIAAAGSAGSKIHNGVGTLSQVALSYDLIHDDLSSADRRAISSWMVESGVRGAIREVGATYFRGAGVNARLSAMVSALFFVLVVDGDPGVPNLDRERGELLRMFDATMFASHGEDGYPIEDIGYGTAVSAYLSHLAEAVRRAGLYDAYRQCPRFANFGRSILHFVQPWGSHLTSTGDHYDGFMDRSFVLARQAAMSNDPAVAWLAATLHCAPDPRTPTEVPIGKGLQLPASWLTLAVLDDHRPVHPRRAQTPTHFMDRTRGLVSFRSSWDEQATYVTIDGSERSPSAQGHEHASCGHFNLSAVGEYFGIDAGRYNMEQSCHSVVLVDGKSGRSSKGEWKHTFQHGLLTDYRPGAFVDSAAVDSSHQHDCFWARRTLALVKGRGAMPYVWMVDNINKANDWAEFWWQLHTSPENTITLRKHSATIRGWRQGNFLDVHFALPDPKIFPKPHTLALAQDEAICSSTNYIADSHGRAREFARPADMMHHSVFVRPRLLAKVAGYNGRFMSLLLPRKKRQKQAKVQRLRSLENTLALRVVFDQVEDVIVWAYEHHLLEAEGVSERGNWCVIRRSRDSQRILHKTIG